MDKPDPTQPQQKLTVLEAVAKLREIRHGLEALVADLKSNIEALDDDPDFQDRMQDLQRDADERASSLEKEVKRLRGDVKSIKDLLGGSTDRKPADSS
jgi:hypothetical protein